ncbi:rhomboid family intramembrane serine protease [Chondromyces crocatus]|uniref:rhomboid family intramembrane serine protease n=1 Tax=Chondromyces crocatus TaxID=52 RepID=UPI001FDF5DAC|nr:rhomboid family intramembrane serine protease [Chondromyces crocatus]
MSDRNSPSPLPRLLFHSPVSPAPRWIGAPALPAPGGTGDGGDETGPGFGLTALGPVYGERKAREWALVLQSSEIWHLVQHTRAGWVLLVRDEDYVRASGSIDRYEAENRDWPPRPQRERPRHPQSAVAVVMFAALALFFSVTGPVMGGSQWFRRGSAVADLVLHAEPWRAVTALTLHADTAHMLGNVISGTIFGSAVQRRLGPGGAALAVVASGTLGNFANALWHRGVLGQGHASIGASTAVFGAIGLLAGTQLLLDRAQAAGSKRTIWQIAAPAVGGLALLGALGASPRADLGAHLFGLLMGGVIGLVAALGLRGRATSRRRWMQPLLGALAAGVVVGSWQLAWAR